MQEVEFFVLVCQVECTSSQRAESRLKYSYIILVGVGEKISDSRHTDFIIRLNPIPTGLGHVTLIYGLIPPMAGRNRVKFKYK